MENISALRSESPRGQWAKSKSALILHLLAFDFASRELPSEPGAGLRTSESWVPLEVREYRTLVCGWIFRTPV